MNFHCPDRSKEQDSGSSSIKGIKDCINHQRKITCISGFLCLLWSDLAMSIRYWFSTHFPSYSLVFFLSLFLHISMHILLTICNERKLYNKLDYLPPKLNPSNTPGIIENSINSIPVFV